ncbi:MAG: transporter substrate-binding domain-containing protein [Halioglobus sp.]
MYKLFGKLHTTIRLTVMTVFVVATIVTVGLASALQYYFGQAIARDAAADLYATAAASVAVEMRSIGHINTNVIELLADNPVLRDPAKRSELLEIFASVLKKNPLYYGVYLGSGDGHFFELINLAAGESARRALQAEPADRWVVMQVEPGAGVNVRHFHYLDESMQTRRSRSEATTFDVTSRPWYTRAMDSNGVQFSSPYLFAQLDLPGRTFSHRLTGSDTVVGIDITLAASSDFLRDLSIAEQGVIYLFNDTGEILASSNERGDPGPMLPKVRFDLTAGETALVGSLGELRVSNELDWPPIDFAQSGEPRGYSIDLLRLLVDMTGIRLRFVNGHGWQELVQLFQEGSLDILQSVALTDRNAAWGLPGNSYLQLPFALATRDDAPPTRSLAALNGQTLAIPQGWSVIETVREHFPGITLVPAASSLDALQKVIAGEATAALDNASVLRHTLAKHYLDTIVINTDIDFGAAPVPDKLHMLVHKDQAALRALLDRAIAAITPAQHAALRDRWLLTATDVLSQSSGIVPSRELLGMAKDDALQGRLIEARTDGEEHLAYVKAVGTASDAMYLGILASADTVFGPVLDKVKLSSVITSLFLLCLLPLTWFFANPIVRPVKQLARENDKVQRRDYDSVERVRSHVKELDELSDSMVSMVSAIKRHELAQRRLMDSFIELIAEAIDDKSSHTGGHCERVPELALMLAEHASDSNHPAFAGFSLQTEDEWREFRIAAWLHDCGKITTPEHIVDKGSKLETIYNRVHEVRTRFEVLLRDAHINYLEQLIETPGQQARFARELAATQQRLASDFEFVARCNVGGESLDEASLKRLRQIADTTWQRHFSDRIGLSPLEELRLRHDPAVLPATEKLLSDKPEHIVARETSNDYASSLGIDMEIPEHEANLGELYNLSVSRGTLTREDRISDQRAYDQHDKDAGACHSRRNSRTSRATPPPTTKP